MKHRLRVVPYTWNPTTDPTEGIAIMRGQFIKAFIPFEDVASVADRMIDLLEQYEQHESEAA